LLDGALARREQTRSRQDLAARPRRTQRLLARGLVGTLALTLALAAPAVADTTVAVDGSMNLTVTGNDDPSTVTITESGANAFTVTDPAADLTAGASCTGGGATVSCTGVTGVILAHGNGGDDTITVAATTARRSLLSGEAGADKLTGGAGDDDLRGDAGPDEMRGGAGRDDLLDCSPDAEALLGEAGDDILRTCSGPKQLSGGPGDDFLSANVGPGQVEMIGGDGEDEAILFAQSMSGWVDVSVSLDDQPNDGPAGNGSNMHSDVENIVSAGGSDTITGTAGPNTIRSDAYSDGYGFSSTEGGNDSIDPGGGADRVYAGGGDDTISSRDQVADAINCGSNFASPLTPGLPPVDNDTVTGDAIDAFVSCENVSAVAGNTSDGDPPRVKLVAPRTITTRAFRKGLKVRLSADEPASFVAELAAKVRGRRGTLAFAGAVGEVTIGQGRLRRGRGTRALRLRPSAKFAKAVRGKPLRLVVRVVATDAAGNVATAARKVRVKRGSR